jgi:hypothetical protein
LFSRSLSRWVVVFLANDNPVILSQTRNLLNPKILLPRLWKLRENVVTFEDDNSSRLFLVYSEMTKGECSTQCAMTGPEIPHAFSRDSKASPGLKMIIDACSALSPMNLGSSAEG